jgi:hypothetical protein
VVNQATVTSTNQTGPISVTITPQPSNVAAGATVAFTATVSNAGNLTGVTWTVTGLGSIDTFGNYTAPNTTSSTAVTITATSLADSTKIDSIQFTIAPDALTTSQPPATVSAGQPAAVQFQLAGVPPTSTVEFMLSCTNLPPGGACSFSSPFITGQSPNANVTILTSGGAVTALTPPAAPAWPRGQGGYLLFSSLLSFALALMALFGHTTAVSKRILACGLLLWLGVSVVLISSCAGFSNSPSVSGPTASSSVTPAGTYRVAVLATPQSSAGGFVQTQLIVPFTVNWCDSLRHLRCW